MSGGQQDNSNDAIAGVIKCRASMLGKTDMVECLTEVHLCRWRTPYGEGTLCVHPSGSMIAHGDLPSGWSF